MNYLRAMIVGSSVPRSLVVDLFLALSRVGFGLLMAFGHGINKLPGSERFDGFSEGVGNMGFPLPGFFAFMAAMSEFLGGLLLAAGLLTRPMAFFLLGTMFVAAFIAHGSDPLFAADAENGSKEMALLFLLGFLPFLVIGSGRFGVDYGLRLAWKKQRSD